MLVILMLEETQLQMIINQILAFDVELFKVIPDLVVAQGTSLFEHRCDAKQLLEAQSVASNSDKSAFKNPYTMLTSLDLKQTILRLILITGSNSFTYLKFV